MVAIHSPGSVHIAAFRALRRFMSRPKRQQGQAMPLGIAFILVGMVGAFVLFNTGQVAVNKQRLSDAADSAAYSGMVWQARALNFQAYTNRAMIANDVTIGQAVSLASWSTYAAIATGNIATVTKPVPILNGITQALADIFRMVSNVVKPVADVMVTVMSTINKVIGVSQEAMFVSSFIATPDVVYQVAKASDEDFEAVSGYAVAGLAMNLATWQGFTEKYEQDDVEAMRERTDMISESRDPFATHRHWRFFEKFWFFMSPFTHYRLYYDGQTRLLMTENASGQQNWEWVAKDGLSLHTKIYYFKRLKWRKRVEQAPIGWAAAYANSDGSKNTKTIDTGNSRCRSYTTFEGDACKILPDSNKNTEKLANTGSSGLAPGVSTSLIGLSGYQGVEAFRSLSQKVLEDEDGTGDPILRLRTEISMDVDKTKTSNDWVHDSEPFATEITSAGNKLSSISIAEVYYRHPKAYRTSKNEIALQRANGYNPYWDVRLAAVELEERLAALALREGLSGTGTTLPGANQLASYAGGDPDLEFDLGGNISGGLGEYAGTLAKVMGLDESIGGALEERAAEIFTERTGYTVDDILAFKSDNEDEIRKKIEDELKNQLEAIGTQLLASFFGGDINVDVDGLTREAERITEDALAINEKMEAMKEQVAADFEAALIREVGPYEQRVQELRDQMQPYRDEITELKKDLGYNDDQDRRTQEAIDIQQGYIDRLQDSIKAETQGLKDKITDSVIASINRNGADFFKDGVSADFRTFLEEDLHTMIIEYVTLPEEERANHKPGGVLPWDDEEEVDPADAEETEYGSFEN